MLYVVLIVLGLAAGSFANAAIWRLKMSSKSKVHKVSKVKKEKSSKKLSTFNFQLSTSKNRYSIFAGRSMCPNCKHTLAAKDLVPVFSWFALGGKCRYCKKPISAQYPLVELATAILFLASYIWWPYELTNFFDYTQFAVWLISLTGLVILFVYDAKWLILPDAITLPLIALAIAEIAARAIFQDGTDAIRAAILGLLSSGGFFYLLFIISNGKWIGGGDVKLGILLGLLLGWPKAVIALMLGFYGATLIVVPLLLLKVVHRKQHIPFGPFLIAGTFIAMLFSEQIVGLYYELLLY